VVLEFKLLLILIAANGTPVILHRWLGGRFSWPLDGGMLFSDGYPLLGSSKTWRGFFSGMVGATIVATMLGFSVGFGAFFGALSLLGDMGSSFIKRRMNQPDSSKAMGIDQVPEALLPLIAGAFYLDYGGVTIVIVTLLFFLLNVLISPVLYQLGIRKHPH
jgi:hypothetical protein